MADIITLYGDRKKWIEFTGVVKQRRMKIWNVLLPFMIKYVDDYEQNKKGEKNDADT